MNKKTKLLNALQTLEMKSSDNKRFVDLLVDNSNNNGGEESSIEYIDMKGASRLVKLSIIQYAIFVKGYADLFNGYVAGMTPVVFEQMASNIIDSTTAIAIDFSNVVSAKREDSITSMTIAEAAIQNGATQAEIDTLPRITKEEFYKFPEDEVWVLNTQDDYKAAWDKLYPLVEGYGADYINERRLSLAPWYKSLRINGFGANNIIEYYVDIREDNEFIKNESIGFDNFALKRIEWNDGRVTFDFVEYEE